MFTSAYKYTTTKKVFFKKYLEYPEDSSFVTLCSYIWLII